MPDTQAPDVVVTEADRKTLDEIFIMSLRKAGQERNDDPFLEILARHRLSAQSAMQARIEELELGIALSDWFNKTRMSRPASYSESEQVFKDHNA